MCLMSLEQTTKSEAEQLPAQESIRELEDSELKGVAGGARSDVKSEMELQQRYQEEGGR